MKKIIVLIAIFLSVNAFSQNSSLDFNSTISQHLKEFRSTIGQNANVFIEFDYDFKNVALQEHDYILQPYINPKKLKSKDNYMVKFMVLKDGGQLILRAVNFRINKISRKKIEFVNLMNGKDYK